MNLKNFINNLKKEMILIHAKYSDAQHSDTYEAFIIYTSINDLQINKIHSDSKVTIIIDEHVDIRRLINNPPLILNNMYFAEILDNDKFIEVSKKGTRLYAQYKLNLFNFEKEFFNKINENGL